ncbi:para-aminobenzoate synthetase [Lipingzhangella halophila]|uniref:aminodeoxychorismate synthase n=1 Tax=Lipingzhangella halophila TaxID=1783352 RepID=A0A7W7RH79_9ACTN|nr:aminodeoxychorismate synthase component I [Lipingzhangella halophila]MBB4931923.1 para-aminobenzoate synthetase [Lipingzhangella halophila]
MRLLLVDNHDSYTYNLFQLLSRVLGERPTVLTNDDPRWDSVDPADFDAAVISPGPGRPQHPRDLGQVPRVLAVPELPILGVCLGHQAIAHQARAHVEPAPAPRHGHLTRVRHAAQGLFTGLPQEFTAVRYHSLATPGPLPAPLTATAWAEDGVIMALEHATLPRWGVQFHPESVATEHGTTLVANFARLAQNARAQSQTRAATTRAGVTETPDDATQPEPAHSHLGEHPNLGTETRTSAPGPQPAEGLRVRMLPHAVDTDHAFVRLHGESPYAFWLDSSRVGGTARFSFLGDASGPTGEVLTYRVGDGAVTVRRDDGERREQGTIFDALRRRVAHRPHSRDTGLPFDFTGGYVGYFGYELKADCGGAAPHRAPTPDAVWLRCDRVVAVDHATERTYLVASAEDPGADAWLAATERALATSSAPPPPAGAGATGTDLEPLLERPREQYLTDIKQCLAYLAAGESYEICLTNRLRLPAPHDDVAYYRRLRAARPAPYAALLRLGEVSVLSAAPERFLRIDADGVADSRPIKGTAPRHPDPGTDRQWAEALRTGAKTRAENLMIVDLLRNDLGRVCEIGSVAVPEFMYTESYATVHQLVSTVRGTLRCDVSPIDAIRACFPGGSMTGAPKLRTMEIIDRLESSARGVYSGALGYVSHNGTTDLSIVIRTAIRHGDTLTVGAGGAIVLDSDPDEEYAEMLLKAAVPIEGG